MNHLVKLISTICLTMLFMITCLQAGEIHKAVYAGDLGKVRALIEADPALLEAKDNSGGTPLHMACGNLQVEVANFLIDKGADVNAKNIYKFSVLSTLAYAINDEDECIGLMQRLIDKGAEVNLARAEVGSASDLGSPLHMVAIGDNLKAAKILIDNGADLHAPSRHGTPLQFNILWGTPQEEMAKFLVENGAKPQEYSAGNTDVHLAAVKGRADLLQTMAKYGADINAMNEYGHTPLYYAARHGHRRAAEVLIAAGANKSAIAETNYGKAPQLMESLKQGEAYLWDSGGMESPSVGYTVKTKEHLLIFNPSRIEETSEAGLANGCLNPNELAGQKITVFISYKSNEGKRITEFAKRIPEAYFVLNFDPPADNTGSNHLNSYKIVAPNKSYRLNGLKVHTIPAASRVFFGGEGLGYLVEADGMKIFHAGLHVSDNNPANVAKFRKEIDFLKPFGPIDIAILLIRTHHSGFFDYEPYLYLIDQLAPKAIYLMGDKRVYEEHQKCLKILKAGNVPVYFPEGGIAIGERFHYVRD